MVAVSFLGVGKVYGRGNDEVKTNKYEQIFICFKKKATSKVSMFVSGKKFLVCVKRDHFGLA
jgi:hypothetical protein